MIDVPQIKGTRDQIRYALSQCSSGMTWTPRELCHFAQEFFPDAKLYAVREAMNALWVKGELNRHGKRYSVGEFRPLPVRYYVADASI
ncbi:MAG: hypothetical protein ABSA45_02130 [Verrucomicrobiota bacterium]|jgi:hypothetical protein